MESGQFVVRLFKYSGAILLLVAATAKIVSGLGFAEVLKQVDPFFGMQFGHLMLVVGILELAIVANWFFSSSERFGLLPVAWLTTCLVIYRLGLWQIGWHGQCHCLGNFTDSIHVSPQVADNIMKGVLAYLLIGSYGILFHQWWKNRKLAVGRSHLETQKS